MRRTQRITTDWLQHSGISGNALLLEALLRRGFLAYQDGNGVWLGTGSHPADLIALQFIDGLEVAAISGHRDRMARLRFKSPKTNAQKMDVAAAIIGLPENNDFWTGIGVACFTEHTWARYRKMVWGAKLPACPMSSKDQQPVNNALDLGAALLVKTLPLARVATAYSCDGHGDQPALISPHFDWDMQWGKAVFDVLAVPTPSSIWIWENNLNIAPIGSSLNAESSLIFPAEGFRDAQILAMLDDIQHFARRLLDQRTIDKIGRARTKMLAAFSKYSPKPNFFANEAKRQLDTEFGKMVEPKR